MELESLSVSILLLAELMCKHLAQGMCVTLHFINGLALMPYSS